LPHLSAKGLCKYQSATLKENRASVDQRTAWLGQETEDVDSIHSKTADKEKVIEGPDIPISSCFTY
jgi:hypothetical protein